MNYAYAIEISSDVDFMVKIDAFVVVIIVIRECFHLKMRGMTNKETKVLGNRISVQLCTWQIVVPESSRN